jgi:hypothetical protein
LEASSAENDNEDPPVENDSNFDPRPGNAHVFLPYIDFDETEIAKFLESTISSVNMSQKSRNILLQIKQMFESVTVSSYDYCTVYRIVIFVNLTADNLNALAPTTNNESASENISRSKR